MDFDAHMVGFEREAKLKEAWVKVRSFQTALYKWKDFMNVVKVLNPDLSEGAFNRRACKRKLRYIGHNDPENYPLSLIVGAVYESTTFNGATYTIVNEQGEEQVTGCAYFEVPGH